MIFLQFLGVLNQHSHHPRPGLEESFDGVGGLSCRQRDRQLSTCGQVIYRYPGVKIWDNNG